MRPQARGRLTLDNADSKRAPKFTFNYMGSQRDRFEMRQGIRHTREIIAQAPFDRYRGKELGPGADAQSDTDIDAWVRKTGESAYHPCGTCRMGDDDTAVVDANGRVHGVDALRVVDASIMPRITTGNLNAPTIMMAEKIADAIRDRTPLEPSEAPWYEPANWSSAQR